MASIYFSYPLYSNKKDLSAYEYHDESNDNDKDDSDYERDIEYSLDLQDKLERSHTNISGSGSGSSSGSSRGSRSNSLSSSPKSSSLINNTKQHQHQQNEDSPNQIKSVDQILDEIEREKQESKHRKVEIEKSHKLTTTQVNDIINKETNTKKRLPSVEEIYNRIKWDHGLQDKQDKFNILYQDGLGSGLIEVSFKSFDINVVPIHKVQIFKYLNTIIYSRKERLYNFDSVYNN